MCAINPTVKLRIIDMHVCAVEGIEFGGGIMAEMAEGPIDNIGSHGIAAGPSSNCARFLFPDRVGTGFPDWFVLDDGDR